MLSAQIKSSFEKFRSFVADRRGVSAIEFAIIAPLMISLYLGGVEITQALSASQKTTVVARTVTDLAAQVSTISDTDMTDMLKASSAIIAPFNTANLRVVVSSIKIDNAGSATVAWSDAMHGTPHAVGSAITLDNALATPNTSVILGEVTYLYTPVLGSAITGTLDLSYKIYMRPRISACVTRPPTVTTC